MPKQIKHIKEDSAEAFLVNDFILLDAISEKEMKGACLIRVRDIHFVEDIPGEMTKLYFVTRRGEMSAKLTMRVQQSATEILKLINENKEK